MSIQEETACDDDDDDDDDRQGVSSSSSSSRRRLKQNQKGRKKTWKSMWVGWTCKRTFFFQKRQDMRQKRSEKFPQSTSEKLETLIHILEGWSLSPDRKVGRSSG